MSNCGDTFPFINGQAAGGGGGAGGVTIPGSVFWTFANDGGPADGIITTTDATPVFRTWCTLLAPGDAVNFLGFFYGVSSTGNQGLFRQTAGGYARNGVGDNTGTPVAAVVNSGWEDIVTAPWNTFLPNPAGWGGGVNYTPGGGIIQVAFNSAVGQTVQWRCLIIATPFFGATIEV